MEVRKNKKVQRILSFLLALIIGVTGIPWNTMTTYAAEETTVLEPTVESEPVENLSVSESTTESMCTFTFVPDEHAKVYDESGMNEITELKVPIDSSESVNFIIKPNDGYTVYNVAYTTASYMEPETITGYYVEDGGYWEYYAPRMFEDCSITVTTRESCKITFKCDNYEGIEIQPVIYDEANDYYSLDYEQGSSLEFTISKDEAFYFAVVSRPEKGKLLISTTGDESGALKSVENANSEYEVYKIVPTNDMVVTIQVSPVEIPLTYDERLVEDVKISCDTGDEGQTSILFNRDKKVIQVYYDAEFTLLVKPAAGRNIHSFYKVCPVYELDEEDEPYLADSYKELVGYEVDEDGYYCASFDTRDILEVGIHEGCTVSFEAPNTTIYDIIGEDFITELVSCRVGGNFDFRVFPDKRYKILYVTDDGTESGKLEEKTYTDEENGISYSYYSVEMTGDKTVTVVTEKINKQIVFANECNAMTYTVTSELFESDTCPSGGNYYYIDKDADNFAFSVTVTDGKAHPDVMTKNNEGIYKTLTGEESVDETGRKVYSYVIPAEDLTDEMTVYIADDSALKKLTVVYDSIAMLNTGLTVDGAELLPVRTQEVDGTVTAVYEIEKGKTAVVSAESNEYYSIGVVSITKGNELETAKKTVSGSKYSGKIFLDVNTTITFQAKGKVVRTLKQIHPDGRETDCELTGSSYAAMIGETYKICLTYGKTPLVIENVSYSGEYLLKEDEPGCVVINIPNDDRKKSLSFRCTATYQENGKNRKQSFSISFRISSEIESVTVTESPKKETIIDSNRIYTISTNPSNSSASRLGVEVISKNGVLMDSITYKWNPTTSNRAKLTVCADARAGYGEVAEIRLYRKDKLPGDPDYYVNVTDKNDEPVSMVLKTVEPKSLINSTPETEIVSTDDISMTLKLHTPYAGGCVNGRQYYKVEVIPEAKEGEQIPASILEATSKPFFIGREFPEYDEEGNEIPGFEQITKLVVNNAGIGGGQAWKYKVKVTLVQTYDKTPITAENASTLIAFSSQVQEIKDAETKDPVFITKLSLEKKASRIYTAQEDILAANLKCDKDAICIDAVAEDTTNCAKDEKLSVKVENSKLFISANSKTAVGKHTITVMAVGPETMYRPSATLTIDVVKGIESIKITVPSNSIYKKEKAKATLQASVVYNEDDTAPKTKKVTWSIVDESGMELTEEHALYNKVTMKNGTVTVNKDVDVSQEPQTFCIKATAADYVGNNTTAISEVITISSEAIQPGAVLIVKKDESDESNSVYHVVARNGSSVPELTTDKLHNTKLVVLKNGEDVPVKESYSEEELADFMIPATQLTVKSSAVKSINLVKSGDDIAIQTGKPAKNIKLTVTTNDGGKKSAMMKVTIVYAEPDELSLAIYEGSELLNTPSSDQMDAVFSGTVNTKLTLKVMQKTGEAWNELNAYTNHIVKVSGGKILTSDVSNGVYTIIVSGEKATITLTDKVNRETKKYTITNTNYSKNTAPSVKIVKKTPSSIVCGVLADRNLQYQITSKKYSCTNKYVLIETEAVSAAKKPEDYEAFAKACDKIGVYTPVSDGTLKLNFTDDNIPLGNYKLTLTFGNMSDGKLTVDAKPVTVTVKVVKAKTTKGSYKAATTYKNVLAVAGEEILLTGSGKNLHSVAYTDIIGANVKGAENKFLEYFRLENNKLIIREDLTAQQLEELKNSKTDNYGYLSYTAVFGDNGYGVPFTESKTVKVTVKLKK